MQWGILILVLLGLLLTYVILQDTRAHTHWRGLVAKGDVSAIALLLTQEFARWQSMRPPRGTSTALWHGVQSVELIGVGARAAHVNCTAEGEYRFSAGRPVEITSQMEAALRVAAKLVELIMFDVPNLRLAVVRVDVYSSFHDGGGPPLQRCILSTVAERAVVDDLDWEGLLPHELIDRLESRYDLDERGLPVPFEPDPPLEDTAPPPVLKDTDRATAADDR